MLKHIKHTTNLSVDLVVKQLNPVPVTVAVTNIIYINASMLEVIRQKFYVHLLLPPCISCVEYVIVTAEVATHEKRNGEIYSTP
jgi:hypothetical protein